MRYTVAQNRIGAPLNNSTSALRAAAADDEGRVLTVIDSRSDLDFVWRNLRSYLGFRLRIWINALRNGHAVRAAAIRRYLASTSDPKLHLGATVAVPGILNSQITGRVPIDVTRRLPLPDRTFALIYSSHLVEHVHRREFHRFLAEGLRVLRPGGLHVVAAPSAEKIARAVYGHDGNPRELLFDRARQYFHDGEITSAHQMNLAMRGFGHRFLYDTDYMRWIGARVGYVSVEKVGNFEVPDPGICAYLKSHKPPRWDAQTETWVFRAPG